MNSRPLAAPLVVFVATIMASAVPLAAHNGPPYPVVTDKPAGNYLISLWADPDASDDGSADGRFWVVVKPSAGGVVPSDTRVQVSIWPADRPASVSEQTAQPDQQDASRRLAAFVIDHEGRYGVRAAVAGSLGGAEIDTTVDAEYDARPRPALIALFAMPFVLIGFVWVKLTLRRRAARGTV